MGEEKNAVIFVSAPPPHPPLGKKKKKEVNVKTVTLTRPLVFPPLPPHHINQCGLGIPQTLSQAKQADLDYKSITANKHTTTTTFLKVKLDDATAST